MFNLKLNTELRRNVFFIYMNAFIYAIGAAIIPLETTLNYFISGLTSSKTVIALLSALSLSLIRFPQLFMAKHLKEIKNPIPLYLSTTFLKTIIYFLIGIVIIFAESSNFLLVSFYILYSLLSILKGVSSVIRVDIMGDIIPNNIMGSFYGYRAFFSNLGGIIGTIAIVFIPIMLGIPKFYGVLFIIMSVFSFVSFYALTHIEHEYKGKDYDHITAKEYWQSIKHILKTDSILIKFITTKWLAILGTSIYAFLAIYAKETMGFNLKNLFLINIIFAVSKTAFSIIWGKFDDVHTWKSAYIIGRVLHVLNFSLILLFPSIITIYVVFFLKGVTKSCFQVATEKAYIELGKENKATYTGIINLTVFPVVLISMLTFGFLVDTLGYFNSFILSIIFTSMSFILLLF